MPDAELASLEARIKEAWEVYAHDPGINHLFEDLMRAFGEYKKLRETLAPWWKIEKLNREWIINSPIVLMRRLTGERSDNTPARKLLERLEAFAPKDEPK